MPQDWINGTFGEASISIRDTGLLHAAGLFTTMRADEGRVFRLDRHLARLRESCQALFIPIQYNDEQLTDATNELLARNELPDARLRITVTRGAAASNPNRGLFLQPTVFITATALEPYPAEYYERGLTVMLVDEQKLNPYDIQAGHKTLNYFSRLAALREANRRGAGEALWFNIHNYLQSGSISNVFIVKDNQLITPPTPAEMLDSAVREASPYPRSAVLPGIMRGAVLALAASAGIAIKLEAIDVNLLLDADEVFVTNSIMRVMPVCRIERSAIGGDRPGPVTLRITELISDLIDRERRG
jgi:branched-subunit amino acid aminotransferase/4-amino-4-deoxychorismate lyase